MENTEKLENIDMNIHNMFKNQGKLQVNRNPF
jgi:hypothetical protein